MFTIFGRYHRHKDYEETMLFLANELSTIRSQITRIIAKSAVEARENQKKTRETTVKSLPQDVRDIIAQFPGGKIESVLDSDGHAVYSEALDK